MTTHTLATPAAASGPAIHGRALLASLHISTWIAKKFDRQATAKVHAIYNAQEGSARVNKDLLPGAAVYAQLIQRFGAIRIEHKRRTLAWGDAKDGWRLLTTAAFADYTDWLRKETAAVDALADAFCIEYPRLIPIAKRALNGLFNEADYPSPERIRDLFSIKVDYAPVPAVGDVRVDLAADQIAAIEASITDRVQASVNVAMRDAWTRLHTVAARMAERLSTPDGVFRDTLVANAIDVCDSLKRLNVTNDADLETMRARIEVELTRHSPQALRDDTDLRQETAGKAQAIVDAMAGFFTDTHTGDDDAD
jgi:hypothetical protein